MKRISKQKADQMEAEGARIQRQPWRKKKKPSASEPKVVVKPEPKDDPVPEHMVQMAELLLLSSNILSAIQGRMDPGAPVEQPVAKAVKDEPAIEPEPLEKTPFDQAIKIKHDNNGLIKTIRMGGSIYELFRDKAFQVKTIEKDGGSIFKVNRNGKGSIVSIDEIDTSNRDKLSLYRKRQ